MPTGAKYRVLVVDDDPRCLEALAAVLSLEVDVIAAASAERALAWVELQRFHVVCSDFKMPGMNGLELLTRIAALPDAPGCLLFTGSDDYCPTQDQSSNFVLRKPVN